MIFALLPLVVSVAGVAIGLWAVVYTRQGRDEARKQRLGAEEERAAREAKETAQADEDRRYSEWLARKVEEIHSRMLHSQHMGNWLAYEPNERAFIDRAIREGVFVWHPEIAMRVRLKDR